MRGMIFAAGIWAAALVVVQVLTRRRGGLASLSLNRETFALVFLLLGTKAVAAGATADEVLENPVVVERIARGGLAIVAALIVLPSLIGGLRSTDRPRLGAGLVAAWVYVGVATVSTIYSVAPVVTAGKVFELAVGVAIAASAALRPDPAAALRQLLVFALFLEGILILVAVVGFFAVPSVFSALQPRPGFVFRTTMIAPYAHNNVLAALAGMFAGVSLGSALMTTAVRQRRAWMTAFVLFTLGVALASGRQGVIIWAATVGLTLFVLRRSAFLLVLVPVSFVALSQVWGTVWRAVNRNALYDLRTLTGRLSWWGAAIESWTQHPWTGFGFGAGGRFVALSATGGRTANVHNGYLEALVGVGLMGFLPMCIIIAQGAKWSIHQLKAHRDVRYAVLLLGTGIHTMVDLGFGAWLKPDFIILACLAGLAGTIASRPQLTPTSLVAGA
jgi:O-antigen ligase